jgi:2-keto-4-pentenoate hydratase/2-oxohepta-3-ene-1,7-dioic acid hydratase in catechol pathway
MQIFRYADPTGAVHYGVDSPAVSDGRVRATGDPFAGTLRPTAEPAQIARFLAPIVPTTIWCIGLNYRKHAAETNKRIPDHPVVFAKGINAVQNPQAPIVLPRHLRSDEVDYEGELAVVIGKPAKNVPRERALDYVLGYTIANDVSARDWQGRFGGGQFCRGKTFDTFCPLGPRLMTRDEIPDPNRLEIQTTVSGEVLQQGDTSDMIFDVPTLISFLSGSTTLPAGTVILTGTPHGVGMARTPPRWLRPGDYVSVFISVIGQLNNPVIEEPVSWDAP